MLGVTDGANVGLKVGGGLGVLEGDDVGVCEGVDVPQTNTGLKEMAWPEPMTDGAKDGGGEVGDKVGYEPQE